MRYSVIRHSKTKEYLHFSVSPTTINLSTIPMLYPVNTEIKNLRMLFLDHEVKWDWNNFIVSEVELTNIEE